MNHLARLALWFGCVGLAQAPRETQAQLRPLEILSSTLEVTGLARLSDALLVASTGGLEEYDLQTLTRRRVVTTEDGLPRLALDGVSVDSLGVLWVDTAGHACQRDDDSARFECTAAPNTSQRMAPLRGEERLEGARITARITDPDGTEWLGTAGLGTWMRRSGLARRLTPSDVLTSNHVVAIAEHRGETYLATFDRGVVRQTHRGFSAVSLGPRLTNDLVSTPEGLFVATSEGLYVSPDGQRFDRERRVTETAVNDLAYDATNQILYATATNSLWELSLTTHTVRSVYLPGGSRSLQAVDLASDGTLWLASEDRGVMRRRGSRSFVTFDRIAGLTSSWAIDVLGISSDSALFGSLSSGLLAIGEAEASLPTSLSPWILYLGRSQRVPGRVFVGTQGGAALLEGQSSQVFLALPDPRVHVIAELASGLWVGTEGGLARYPLPPETHATASAVGR